MDHFRLATVKALLKEAQYYLDHSYEQAPAYIDKMYVWNLEEAYAQYRAECWQSLVLNGSI